MKVARPCKINMLDSTQLDTYPTRVSLAVNSRCIDTKANLI